MNNYIKIIPISIITILQVGEKKKSIVLIQSIDDKCFQTCMKY